jgi:hypothetical protein
VSPEAFSIAVCLSGGQEVSRAIGGLGDIPSELEGCINFGGRSINHAVRNNGANNGELHGERYCTDGHRVVEIFTEGLQAIYIHDDGCDL